MDAISSELLEYWAYSLSKSQHGINEIATFSSTTYSLSNIRGAIGTSDSNNKDAKYIQIHSHGNGRDSQVGSDAGHISEQDAINLLNSVKKSNSDCGHMQSRLEKIALREKNNLESIEKDVVEIYSETSASDYEIRTIARWGQQNQININKAGRVSSFINILSSAKKQRNSILNYLQWWVDYKNKAA